MIRPKEFPSIKSKYRFIKRIGSGLCSVVYKAELADNSLLSKTNSYAIKVYRGDYENYFLDEYKIYEEIAKIKCDNLLKLTDTLSIWYIQENYVKQRLCHVFDFYEMSLADFIHDEYKSNSNLPLYEIKSIFNAITNGLSSLHDADIIHTDIKPENIYLNTRKYKKGKRSFSVVIGDMGASVHKPKYKSVGTTEYWSPEIILRLKYGLPSDIWALGCLLYELSTGNSLFYNDELKTGGDDDPLGLKWEEDDDVDADAVATTVNTTTDIADTNGGKDMDATIINTTNDDVSMHSQDEKESSSNDESSSDESSDDSSDDELSNDNNDNLERLNMILQIESVLGNMVPELQFYSKYHSSGDSLFKINNCSNTTIEQCFINNEANAEIAKFATPIIKGCLKWLPTERITAKQILNIIYK